MNKDRCSSSSSPVQIRAKIIACTTVLFIICCSFSGAQIRKEIYSLKVYCFSTHDNLWYFGKCLNPVFFQLMGTQLHTLHQTRKKLFLRNEHCLISRKIYFKIHAIVQIRVLMQVDKDVKWSGGGNFPSKKCSLILDLFYLDLTWKVIDTCGSICFWQMGENSLGSSWLTLRETSSPNWDIFNE